MQKLRMISWFLMISFFLSSLSFAEPLETNEIKIIRVGLHTRIATTTIEANGDFEVVDLENGKVLKKITSGTSGEVTSHSGLISFQGLKGKTLHLRSLKRGMVFSVAGKRYRGEIELISQGNYFTVVEVAELEEYLYGVLPGEMSPSWPIEALKAQAVAARTYALNTRGKHTKEGYDVCTTTDCQVYRGFDGEAKPTNQAVEITRGEIMTYEGKPILAVFHSASGGYTENSENVWSAKVPYLRGVADFDQGTRHFDWIVTTTVGEFSQKLSARGYSVGKIQDIRLSMMRLAAHEDVTDRGISGRVTKLALIGTNGKKEVAGTPLRSIFGLKSSSFDLYLQKDKNGPKYQIEKAPKGWVNDPTTILIIDGYGWGHGLGLSQWGAKAYAEKYPEDTELYRKILVHYYTGIKFENLNPQTNLDVQ